MTKNITLLIILLALLLAGCSKTYTDSVAATEISLEENQEIIYGQIETITGNDMTLALALAAEPESESESKTKSEPDSESNSKPDSESNSTPQSNPKAEAETISSPTNTPMTQTSTRNMTASQSSGNNAQMPQGTGDGGGQMPPDAINGEQSSNSAGHPDNAQGSDMGSQAPGATGLESQKSGKSQMTSRITYTLTGEKKELRIPVGTTVTTSLGTTTTFSRLASGDMLKLVLETSNDGTETITSIWIVG